MRWVIDVEFAGNIITKKGKECFCVNGYGTDEYGHSREVCFFPSTTNYSKGSTIIVNAETFKVGKKRTYLELIEDAVEFVEGEGLLDEDMKVINVEARNGNFGAYTIVKLYSEKYNEYFSGILDGDVTEKFNGVDSCIVSGIIHITDNGYYQLKRLWIKNFQ